VWQRCWSGSPRFSEFDALVSQKVDAFLETTELPAASAAALPDDVVPEFTPKGELAPVPADEVNVAIAPEMPPPAGRTTQAIVEVHFEVVEGISTIDPATGVKTETWGNRLVDGPDGSVVGTPGPVIRARVGDILRFTITNPAGNHNPHNVDFHSVTGQGGGAEATTVSWGDQDHGGPAPLSGVLHVPLRLRRHPGPHLARDVRGILVDPETPRPAVDHE
jgi:nitrite reductase (NO-forming)